MVFAALVGIGLASCGSGDSDPLRPVDRDASVLVRNRSQYVLLELRIHPDTNYLRMRNLLSGELAIEGTLLFHRDPGDWYVTVYREKYHGGPTLAFTMAEPMALRAGSGYQLDVFDESFRVAPDPYRREGYEPPHDGGHYYTGEAGMDAGSSVGLDADVADR